MLLIAVFFTVSTNKDKEYQKRNHYPVLYFMIACNHLYPIEDKHTQLSLSNINKQVGKPYTHVLKVPTSIDTNKIQILHEKEHLLIRVDRKQFDNTHYICTEKGWVDTLFKHFVQQGDVYNSGIRVSNNKITRFQINNLVIEENPDYHFIKATIDNLNGNNSIIEYDNDLQCLCMKPVEKPQDSKDKFWYHEQTLHALAVEYFNMYFDNNIYSILTPEVMEILEYCKKAPPTEFYRTDANIAFDMNKCYAHILKHGDEFGWGKFMAKDEVKNI